MKRLLKFVGGVVLLTGLGVWFFLGGRGHRQICNVLIISIDTCRADYLSCYGYQRKTTPNIDAIAEQGILFENAVSPVPLTLPAHGSMLTGTIPPYHGVHDNLGYRLGQSNVTLAEILKDNGFVTGAIMSSFVLDSQFGIDQGFDYYNDQFEEEVEALFEERRGQEASRFACNWLAENKDKSFFLFLHYYDPHTKYAPPEPFKSSYAGNLYAGEIAYTDDCISQVIRRLKELDLYDSTLLIIVGDHGESLGERGEKEHGYFIYDCTIKVPLILRYPKCPKGKRVTNVAGLTDIVPTVLGALGLPVPPKVTGRDLIKYSADNPSASEARYIYCESLLPTRYQCNPLLSVVTDGWKYIQTTRPELYDLQNDPGEMDNLAEKQPHRARLMQDHLSRILETNVRGGTSDSELTLDEESRNRLESLGYISSGTIEGSFEFDQTKNDPKDYIDYHRERLVVIYHISEGQFEEAKEICRRLVSEYPNVAYTYYLLGHIAGKEKEHSKAEAYFSRAVQLDPKDYKSFRGLASALFGQGKVDEAIEHFQTSLLLKPGQYEIHGRLGMIFSNRDKFDKAVEHFTAALQINSDLREVHYRLGVAYAHLEKFDDAIEQWNKALALEKKDDPDNTDDSAIHVALADALVYLGRVEQAITHWEESLKLEPDNAKVHADLAKALARKDRVDQAILHLTESLRIEPSKPVLLNSLAELLYTQGKVGEAIRHWRQTLSLRPDMQRALNNLGWIMATHLDEEFRDPLQAVQLAERACDLSRFKNPEFLDTLSAAYATAGKFNKAVQTAEKALKLYMDLELAQKADDVRDRLELFKEGRSYFEEP
jgi:arylsulfatase A-like enzyme/Flp pilus assembly protein TadD